MRHLITSFSAFGVHFDVIAHIPNIHRCVIFLEHGDYSSHVFRIKQDQKKRWYFEIYSKDIAYLRHSLKGKITRIYSSTAEFVHDETERLLCDFRERKLGSAFDRLSDSSELQLTIGTDAFVMIPTEIDLSHHPFFKENTKVINNYLDFQDVKTILDREDADHFDIGDRWIEFSFCLNLGEYKSLVHAARKKQNENKTSGMEWKTPAIE